MSLKEKILEQCENAREASLQLASLSTDTKNFVLYELAEDLLANRAQILKANHLWKTPRKDKP